MIAKAGITGFVVGLALQASASMASPCTQFFNQFSSYEGVVQLTYSQVVEKLPYPEEKAEFIADNMYRASAQTEQPSNISEEEAEQIAQDTRDSYLEQLLRHDVEHNTVRYTFSNSLYKYEVFDSENDQIYELKEEEGVRFIWNNVAQKSNHNFDFEPRTSEKVIDRNEPFFSRNSVLFINNIFYFFEDMPAETEVKSEQTARGTTQLSYQNKEGADLILEFKTIDGMAVPVKLQTISDTGIHSDTYSEYVKRSGLLVPSMVVREHIPSKNAYDTYSLIGHKRITYALQ